MFKKETSFEKRVELAKRIRTKYKDRVPVIVEVGQGHNLTLQRQKFLVPTRVSISGFLTEIRKQISLRPEETIFLFCGSGKVLVPTSNTIGQVYEKYKDEDGFMYITITLESTFGGIYALSRMTIGMLDTMLHSSNSVVRTIGMNKWL